MHRGRSGPGVPVQFQAGAPTSRTDFPHIVPGRLCRRRSACAPLRSGGGRGCRNLPRSRCRRRNGGSGCGCLRLRRLRIDAARFAQPPHRGSQLVVILAHQLARQSRLAHVVEQCGLLPEFAGFVGPRSTGRQAEARQPDAARCANRAGVAAGDVWGDHFRRVAQRIAAAVVECLGAARRSGGAARAGDVDVGCGSGRPCPGTR